MPSTSAGRRAGELDQALTGSYDLIMIDLMLPGLPVWKC